MIWALISRVVLAIFLIKRVRILLGYKWGTIFLSESFWRIEELTKWNGKGIWLREIEKVLRRFDASLEWLMERISLRDEEMDRIRLEKRMEKREKNQLIRSKRKSIAEVFEEVEVLVDTHFFNEFSETRSSVFLKKVLAHQSTIYICLFRKTWRTLN